MATHFFPQDILTRRGPLGRVWTAAHMERKLSKSQTLQTDIEESVDAIVENKVEVLALRVSGQLLLGVVRIYSRKAKYLLDDCNEAFAKIKLAFRPGVVDLAEDQLTVNRTTITLQTTGLGLDMLLPDANWDIDFEGRQAQTHGHHQAHIDDITLRTMDDFQQLNVADPFDIGPSDGIGSQDFQEVDLGIHFDDDAAQAEEAFEKSDIFSASESVGVARHAPRMSSVNVDHSLKDPFADDILAHGAFSREASEAPFGNAMDVDIPEINLEDLGIGFDNMPVDEVVQTPRQTRESSRASSPLTELPPTPTPMEDDAMEIPSEDVAQEKIKRRPKDKRQIIDSVTEIEASKTTHSNAANADVSSITTDQRFLPRSAVVMRLIEIRDDPISYFLPTRNTPNGLFFYAAPLGLSPELADLFARPVQPVNSHKRKALTPGLSPTKRPRPDEVEQLRRTSVPPDVGQDSMFVDHATFAPQDLEFPDQSGVVDDFQLELPEVVLNIGHTERARSVASDRSRYTTPGLDEGEMPLSDATCPIAIFDTRQSSQNDQNQDGTEPDKHGYSKNTVKALGLIRKELRRNGDTEEPLSFNELSQKASKRAASSFFFELLFLGTRDCLRLSQTKSFENIEFTGKPKLWEYQQLSQTDNGSVLSQAPED